MNKEGILIVVSGFSGAGKGTIMKALLERYDNYALSISATTRNPRPGEEEGKAYFFKTTEEFEKMIAKDDLIEYAMYVGNYYGTPKAYVEEQLCAGKDVILEIEIQGALKVKEKPLQASAVKVPLQPSKVQPSKKQTGLNLKQAKTVTKTVKPNYVLKATNSKQKSFLKAPSALFLYRMMGLRQTV